MILTLLIFALLIFANLNPYLWSQLTKDCIHVGVMEGMFWNLTHSSVIMWATSLLSQRIVFKYWRYLFKYSLKFWVLCTMWWLQTWHAFKFNQHCYHFLHHFFHLDNNSTVNQAPICSLCEFLWYQYSHHAVDFKPPTVAAHGMQSRE